MALLIVLLALVGCATSSPKWWKNEVFYQVEVRSFRDSDGDCIGDLRGITENVGYFKELGVKGIVLSNFFKETNFTDVDPDLGSIDEFVQLAATLHGEGIYIVVDYAPGYTSSKHPWFVQSQQKKEPFTDYYRRVSGHTPAWLSPDGKNAWVNDETDFLHSYLQFFGKDFPELNFYNMLVVDEIEEVLKFWSSLGVDGFHLKHISYLYEKFELVDEVEIKNCVYEHNNTGNQYSCYYHNCTTNLYNTYDTLKHWRHFLDAIQNDRKLILIVDPYIQFDLEEGRKYSISGADLVLTRSLLNWTIDTNSKNILSVIDSWYNINSPETIGWMLGNSETSRVGSRLGQYQIDIASMLGLLLPGTYFLYYGEELGMTNDLRDSPKSPHQWDSSRLAGFTSNSDCTYRSMNPNFWELNFHSEQKSGISHYNVHKRLIYLRKQIPIDAPFHLYEINNTTVATARKINEDFILTVLNFGVEPQTYNLLNITKETFSEVMFVYTASINSGLRISDVVDMTSLTLMESSGVVLTSKPMVGPNSAASLRSVTLWTTCLLLAVLPHLQ